MFLEKQPKTKQQIYAETLQAMGALSNLFADTNVPYLNYRATENILCRTLDADNLSRSDCSADAKQGKIGIGIKTFLNNNGKTFQKIAEFNKLSSLYREEEPTKLVNIIATLRNERIQATKRIYGIETLIYHCIVREERIIKVFECCMDEINIDHIQNLKATKNTISFEDGMNEYNFNLSKSTLYKRFYTQNILLQVEVNILDDPYMAIRKLMNQGYLTEQDIIAEASPQYTYEIKREREQIFLPLYSFKNGQKHIPEKSGLNQWNAGGRKRHYDEIYIPIPSWVNREFPNFFPQKDISFDLVLPDQEKISAKICQDNSKALMSNPNKALGKWLLRQVMNLREGEVLTYNMIEKLGIDSVIIYKDDIGKYSIDFAKVDSFEKFKKDKNDSLGET